MMSTLKMFLSLRHGIIAAVVVTGSIGFVSALPASAAVVDVHVGSFYFEDSSVGDGVVTARVGDQIRFIFDDNGSHTADVDELGISTGAQGSGATYVTAVLTKPGTYTLYCRPHRNRGHLTTLVVTGSAATTAAPTTAAPTTAAPTTVASTNSSTTATAVNNTTATTGQTDDPSSTTGASEVNPDDQQEGDDSTATTSLTAANGTNATSGDGSSDGLILSPHSEIAPDGTEISGDQAAGLLPTGATPVSQKAWIRSVRVGTFLVFPLVAIAAIAGIRATGTRRWSD